jgi:hypothetical protein
MTDELKAAIEAGRAARSRVTKCEQTIIREH